MHQISKNITEISYARGERIFIARTHAKDVVTVTGSVFGGPNFFPKNKTIVAGLGAELLDAGTKKYTKEALRDILSSRGASLTFSSAGDRTGFDGSCLPEDLPTLLQVVFECLGSAVFDNRELALLKERVLGDLLEEKSDTRTQAGIAFSRSIFSSGCPNYALTTDEKIAYVKKVTQKDLLEYGSLLGRGGLVLAIVGDVNVAQVKTALENALQTLPEGAERAPEKSPNIQTPLAKIERIEISDKTNIDVYMGCAVPFVLDGTEYLPFVTLVSMLGGKGLSTGHLMRTIRERDGLTYGIYGNEFGFDIQTTGALRIWATFSPTTYEKAVRQTKKEIEVFFKNGITAAALADKKTEMTGSYAVGLSTTHGLAATLHRIGVTGRALSYIDAYPSLIQKITLKDVQRVAKLIPLSKFSLTSAGTFEKK